MGDGADYLFDQAIDQLLDPDFEDEDNDGGTRVLTCRYCGQGGLHWRHTVRYGWRLTYASGALHNCCAKRREYLRHHPHPSHG